jgi:hypothetical protein
VAKRLFHWDTRLRDIAIISATRGISVQRPKSAEQKYSAMSATNFSHQKETIILDAQITAGKLFKPGI